MADKPSLWVRVVLSASAALLVLPLLALTESERAVPNYYVGEIQVTGAYTREDFDDLVRVVRLLQNEESVSWIRVPLEAERAFAKGERQTLPTDVVEVLTVKPDGLLAGSWYTLRKHEGVWAVAGTGYWIR